MEAKQSSSSRNLFNIQKLYTKSKGESEPLVNYQDVYYGHLLSEYRALSLNAADQDKIAIAEEIMKKDSKSWSDIYLFEKIILQIQDLYTIRRRAWNLREKYHGIVSPQFWDAYVNSKPPDPDAKDLDEIALRCDLEKILSEFHWQYSFNLALEEIRSDISKQIIRILFIAITFLLLFALIAWRVPEVPHMPAFFYVLVAGLIGGIVSTLFRLQNTKSVGDAVKDITQLNKGKVNIIISPILGMVFAAILFVLFAGKFLEGGLFPNIILDPDLGYVEGKGALLYNSFWSQTGPASLGDSAKLLIWSFIAGFAERFVPDALNRFVAGTRENQ
jgi:hypothetical protein